MIFYLWHPCAARKALKLLEKVCNPALLSCATTGYCSGVGEGQDLCLGAFQELCCLAGRKQNYSALSPPAVLMPTAAPGGLQQRAERKESSFTCQHHAELALPAPPVLALSGVCLMKDKGQKSSVETLAGLLCCLRCLRNTLDAPDSWKLIVF